MNSFHPELQLKNTESEIRNKLIDLLTKLKGFKFETTLVLAMMKQNIAPFICPQRLKQLLMRVILIMRLN